MSGSKARGERRTLAQQTYSDLREWLISGLLTPGEKVSLRTVADRLEVSMMPVREAVSRLVADRALEVLPNRAVRVPVVSLPQFRELTTIRLVIEGFAAERAADLRDATELAAMQRFDAAFRRQCERARPDVAAAVRANRSLHFAVYQAARLPALLAIIEGLWLRIGPVLNLDLRGSPARLQLGGAEACHADLVKAIDKGDGEGARAALAADITRAASFIESRGVLPDEPQPATRKRQER
jgi:DNA-binding GntR family transcriptional regulator